MMSMIRFLAPAVLASLSLIASGAALASKTYDTVDGYWRTIDDKTGFAKAIVQVSKDTEGNYQGTIVKIIPRPNYTPREFCQNCPAPYTNKPILGLKILNHLQQTDKANARVLTGAEILDPLNGHIYKCKAKLSEDGRRLQIRAYIGTPIIGRSLIWLREDGAPTAATGAIIAPAAHPATENH